MSLHTGFFMLRHASGHWSRGSNIHVGVPPYLGLQIRAVDAEKLARIRDSNPDLPLPSTADSGLLVVGVRRGGPAHRCGLRDLDVITHMRGEPVSRSDEFITAAGKCMVVG